MTTYETNLKDFAQMFPEDALALFSIVGEELFRDFVKDPRYIVRLRVTDDNSRHIELGYQEDEWQIPA